MYTDEPFETADGVVIPQQMNVGADSMVGSGEWSTGERPVGQAGDWDGEASPTRGASWGAQVCSTRSWRPKVSASHRSYFSGDHLRSITSSR